MVNNHIIWCNPAHLVENTESGEQVAGELEPVETSEDNQAEELLARDVLGVPLAIGFGQCAEQSGVHKCTTRSWQMAKSRIDEPCQQKPNQSSAKRGRASFDSLCLSAG